MEQEYMLRLYDRDLLSFTLSEQGLEGLKAKLLWVNKEHKHLLPLDMERSDAGVLKWLQKRVIPKNRAYVAEILKTFGLSINDTKGIIDLDNYAKTRGTPYGIRFETVCREVMGPVQTGQLRKLIGFTFQRHPRLNLPDDRLRAMERHLQKRVRQLLEPDTGTKDAICKETNGARARMMREGVFRRIRSPALLLKKKEFARTATLTVLANSFFTGNSAPMCF